MSNEPENGQPEQPPVILPKCGFCEAEPLTVRDVPLQVQNVSLMVLFCANCRAFLGSSIVNIAQPRVMPAQATGPRIIRPQ